MVAAASVGGAVLSPVSLCNPRVSDFARSANHAPPRLCLCSNHPDSFSSKMNVHVKADERLSILRAQDQFRKWNSLDDVRFCIVCEKKFNGRQIELQRFGNGRYELHCPTEGCNSRPHQWVYPGTPLVSDIVDPHWWRAPGVNARVYSSHNGRARLGRED